MRRSFLAVGVALASVSGLCLLRAAGPGKTAAERGREAILHGELNPPAWSKKAYANAWKQWGLAAKPRDYGRTFQERYGLPAAPSDPGALPLGLMEVPGLWGRGVVNNCLLCHAGSVAGQTHVGLGNASLDLQALFEELTAADGNFLRVPFQFSHVRGTIDPLSPVAFLMSFRTPDLEMQKRIDLDLAADVCSRPPAWWQLKKKKTRDWTGAVVASSTRVDLVNLLTPFNSASFIKKQEPVFADIHAFVLSTQPPKYPFPIDRKRAAEGRTIFQEHCSRCHGTYGAKWTYPNRIVGLDTIGTDPVLAESVSRRNQEYLNKSWFARQVGPDGKRSGFIFHEGYQAPPLDGVWATAPYFHNGSVPTVYHVLNSKARPKVFTRSYRTGKEDYDPVKLGWKVTVLDRPPDPKLSAFERRKVYDTNLRGRSNAGHPFGDKLSERERRAVIEYLKTL